MRYTLVVLCVFVTGCDAVRSTTDRVLGKDDKVDEVTPAVVESTVYTQSTATTARWEGAKKTIASLGDPTTPGRWMQTPLVDTEVTARVVVPRTGAQAYITLVPEPGPESGGSRLSLDAMRALLVPFDELVEVEVYAN